MKYVFRLCARAEESESIEDRHSMLVNGLVKLGGRWGLPPGEYPTPDAGKELSAHFQLGKFLGKGITGFARYRFRGGLRDDPSCDDFIDLEFNPERIGYSELLNEVFPSYVEYFEPYLAYVGDEEFTYIDFDRSRGFNQRAGVLRIHPANYFDERLCNRSFGMSAIATLERLAPAAQRAELIHGGVFFVAKDTPMSIEDAETLNAKLLPQLM